PAVRVSVLLPVRDEAARVGPCLATLLAQAPPPAEILILDDGSTDRTADVVRDLLAGHADLITERRSSRAGSQPGRLVRGAAGSPSPAADDTGPTAGGASPAAGDAGPDRPAGPRVALHTGRPLPPGWLGKPHACAQLAGLADPASSVLVFV